MKIVSWNMGCAPPFARYRKTHRDAWRYLLDCLQPDVAFVQEALLEAPDAAAYGQLFWSEDCGRDSGTAVVVRRGLSAERLTVRSVGSYVAGATVPLGGIPTLFLSIHVGPPNYRKHLRALVEQLSATVAGHQFVLGGDLNAARHLDDVQGGRWFTRFFEDLRARDFHDCHWALQGREVQTFWGPQARELYQCDHLFVDRSTASRVRQCVVIDTAEVRTLSDHGPLALLVEVPPSDGAGGSGGEAHRSRNGAGDPD